MNAANLPSQADLNSLYGAWNPMSYMQGQQNQDLAAQFRDQAQMGNQQALDATQQTYNQKEITNPLEANKLGSEATNLALTVERNTAQRQNNLDADMRSAVLKMDDDQFKTFGNHATKLATSDNPLDQKKGNELLSLLPSAQAERRKAADAMALQKEQTNSHLQGIYAQGKNARDVAQINADAVSSRVTGKAGDPYTAFNKLAPGTRLGITQMALTGGVNPVTHEPLSQEERAQLESLLKQDAAVVDAQALARGQGQGVTTTVDPKTNKIVVVPKQVPSVVGGGKLSDDDLINKYLKK